MEKHSTRTDELSIFISSTMTDLVPERLAIKEAIEEIYLIPVLAEGFGAQRATPRGSCLSWVRDSDIYLGVFWQRYGEVSSNGLSATEEEYQEARKNNKPILIYIKEPAGERDKQLERFLWEIGQYDKGHFISKFTTVNELKKQVKRDVIQEVCRLTKQITPLSVDKQATVLTAGLEDLIQDRIIKRIQEQLDPATKRYKTIDAVKQECKALALKIKQDNFTPNIILGWRDINRTYHGSENIATLLADDLAVESKIINMKELGEKREVIEDCQWLKGLHKVLIVDDACYSGKTLIAIETKLKDIDPTMELRFAVLTKLDSSNLHNLYYVNIHHTEDLLFPWGWSRLIVRFYDIYSFLGISDRRFTEYENTDFGSIEILSKELIDSVRLLTVNPGRKMQQEPNPQFDTFLYFLTGSAEVHIGDRSGSFLPSEYIFIPRKVDYCIIGGIETVKILELLSGGR